MRGNYDTDILEWSEQQANLLRRMAGGEVVNSAELDWPNVAEEIENVGRSELRACEALLRQSLLHALKAEAWPTSPAAPCWRAEAIRFRQEAADAFSPSMRQRIDLAKLYRQAARQLPVTIDGQPPLPVPPECPVSLDDLLSEGRA
jgi:hypothetical protein